MELKHIVLLSVVQGLGEFLPISSSAHLVVLPWFFDFKDPGLAFDVAVHLGTLISLLAYFYRDWIRLIRAWFSSLKKKPAHFTFEEKMIWFLIAATLPGALCGYLVEDYAETLLRAPWLVALTMGGMGLALALADRFGLKRKGIEKIGWLDSLLIGCAQALALIPGVSRSGITITTGLIRGLDRTSAARFSFLLSTPIVAGAVVLKIKDFFAIEPWALLLSIGLSALVGYLSIRYMLYFLQRYSYFVYAAYRLGFAVLVLWALQGRR